MKIVAVAFLVLLASAAWIRFGNRTSKPAAVGRTAPPAGATAIPGKVSVLLSYPRKDLRGVAVIRQELPDDRADLIRWAGTVLAALCRAPDPSVVALFPPGTQLNAVFLDDRRTLYLDFSSAVTVSDSAGVEWETLAIKALSQSVAEAVPEAKAVKILVDGNDRETLWGHVDLRRPFPIRPLSAQ